MIVSLFIQEKQNVDIKLHFIALISNHLGNKTCVCDMCVGDILRK